MAPSAITPSQTIFENTNAGINHTTKESAPSSAINGKTSHLQEPQSTSELVNAGIKHTIEGSAPSIAINGGNSHLQELDASKLVFTRNPNPKVVPEPNSPEVWAQNVYEVFL